MYAWRWPPHASRAGCKTCSTSFGLVHVLALDVFWERLGTHDKCGNSSRPRGCPSAGTSQAVESQLRWPLAEGRASAPGMCASVTRCPAALPLRCPKVQLGHLALRILLFCCLPGGPGGVRCFVHLMGRPWLAHCQDPQNNSRQTVAMDVPPLAVTCH